MILFAYIWPLIAILCAFFIKDLKSKVAWWEYPLVLLLPTVFIIVIYFTSTYNMTRDTERHAGHATHSTYYEAWDEKVPCRHPQYCTITTTGPNGELTTETYQCGYEHLYDVDYHPEHWKISTTLGDYEISHQRHAYLAAKWNNQSFKNMHRYYHSIDGDAYVTHYDQVEENLEPIFVNRSYENRTQVNTSIYQWEEVDPKVYPVYEWERSDRDLYSRSVYGIAGKIEHSLSRLNARIGRPYQCQVLLCVWKDQGQDIALKQRAFWKNGNKNELVINLSVNSNNDIQWVYVFSWMDNTKLHAMIRDEFTGKKLDVSLVEYLREQIPKHWHRKEFSKNAKDGGFSFIVINPPVWCYIVAHILSLVSVVGVGCFIYFNEFDENA